MGHPNLPTAVYLAFMLQGIEPWRKRRYPSMENFSEFSGLADRSYQKLLHPDTPSGRQAQWQTLQSIVDVVFPDGFDIEIKPKSGPRLAEMQAEYARRYSKRIPNIAEGNLVLQRCASTSNVASP